MSAARDLAVEAAVPAYWPRELFCHVDRHHPCPAVIDLTGLARIIVFGPFIVLPPGRWRAAVEFELCAEAATRSFLVEFGPYDRRRAITYQPAAAGLQVASADCDLVRPWEVEIRLAVTRPTFHGELRFHGATIEPLASGSTP